ncbi:RNase Zc3h12a domain containing protein [Trichuris trichiura]|uniref:RNase Zc3h12a domain containing protein n=1 Tax=Trichuris trichiura TaxID=36087 RepID=A0A077ZN94_TRITR|nr:RNase Zc3h12a domain containing protein [Trichuris trichiura]
MSWSVDEKNSIDSLLSPSDESFNSEDGKRGNDFHKAFLALIDGLQLTARNTMLQLLNGDDESELSNIAALYSSNELEDLTASDSHLKLAVRSFPAYSVAINEIRRTPLVDGWKQRPIVVDGRSFQNPIHLIICLRQLLKASHCAIAVIPESALSVCDEQWANIVDCLIKENLLVLTSSDESDVATQLDNYLLLLAYLFGAVILSKFFHLEPLSCAKEWRRLASLQVVPFTFDEDAGVVVDLICRQHCTSDEWLFSFTNVGNAPVTVRRSSEGQFASLIS